MDPRCCLDILREKKKSVVPDDIQKVVETVKGNECKITCILTLLVEISYQIRTLTVECRTGLGVLV